jgi:hypothetical protein
MTLAGMTPDKWQDKILRSSNDRHLLLCSRQTGKSLTAAAMSLQVALCEPGSLVLLLSPTIRQSGELFRGKLKPLYEALGRPVATTSETALQMELANGSRVISLPGDERTVRSYSNVALLVIDEAARVPDSLYYAVRPMLAVSGGRLVCLSSAYAQMGFFYEEWVNGGPGWERTKVTAAECSRISPAFLADERRALGPRIYEREYDCVFCQADDAYFDHDAIVRALASDNIEAPLF